MSVDFQIYNLLWYVTWPHLDPAYPESGIRIWPQNWLNEWTPIVHFLCGWKGAGQLLPERMAHPEALLRGTALPLRASAPTPNYQVGVQLLYIYLYSYILQTVFPSRGWPFILARRKGRRGEGGIEYLYVRIVLWSGSLLLVLPSVSLTIICKRLF